MTAAAQPNAAPTLKAVRNAMVLIIALSPCEACFS
jgi:hypothetical protein